MPDRTIASSARRPASTIILPGPFLRENVKSVLSRFAPAGAAEAPETVWRYLTLDRRRLEELDEAAGVAASC